MIANSKISIILSFNVILINQTGEKKQNGKELSPDSRCRIYFSSGGQETTASPALMARRARMAWSAPQRSGCLVSARALLGTPPPGPNQPLVWLRAIVPHSGIHLHGIPGNSNGRLKVGGGPPHAVFPPAMFQGKKMGRKLRHSLPQPTTQLKSFPGSLGLRDTLAGTTPSWISRCGSWSPGPASTPSLCSPRGCVTGPTHPLRLRSRPPPHCTY